MKPIYSLRIFAIALLGGILFSGTSGCKKEKNVPAPAIPLDFSYTSTMNVFDNVSFTTNTPVSDSLWWDFGDGSIATWASPIHIFRSGGSYTVTLHFGHDSVQKNIVAPSPTYKALMSVSRHWNWRHIYNTYPFISDTSYYPDVSLPLQFTSDNSILFQSDSMGYFAYTASGNYVNFQSVGQTFNYSLYYFYDNDSMSCILTMDIPSGYLTDIYDTN